jgi:hypothetical protein
MRRPLVRGLAAAVLATALAAPSVPADSVFGIRGLGLLGRPLSARAASSGGAFGLFDPATALNPAAFGLWRVPAGWATGVPVRRTYDDGTTSTRLGSTRFPLFGAAVPAGRRLVLAVSMGEYLDRTWGVTATSDTVLRDTAVTLRDETRSLGGVSDLRLGAAYVVSDRVLVGVAAHALRGSTRLGVQRQFLDSAGALLPAFTTYSDLAVTDYSGTGLSAGVQARLSPRAAVSFALRLNSALTATASTGASARLRMPVELTGGALLQPLRGLTVAVSAARASWSHAGDDLAAQGQPRSRDVWSVAVGAELDRARLRSRDVPLRVGYRWRQLPFPVDGAALDEHALSAGVGLDFAGGRATIDLGAETGSRAAGATTERFTAGFVGVVVRP